jgi:TolB-like protein
LSSPAIELHYKGKAVAVKDIRRELGVRYVLEGSAAVASGAWVGIRLLMRLEARLPNT